MATVDISKLNGFKFNGVHSSLQGLIVNSVDRSILSPLDIKQLKIPNRAGGYYFGSDLGVREFNIAVTLVASSPTELLKRMRAVGRWLQHSNEKPLVFDEEKDITYYGFLSGDTNFNRMGSMATTVLKFVCFDPYGYGPETYYAKEKTGATITAPVLSEEPTFPIIRAKFKEDATHFTLYNGKQFIQVGDDRDSDELKVDKYKTLIADNMTDTARWQAHGNGFGQTRTGSVKLASNGSGMAASSYGTGTGWHGPVMRRMAAESATSWRYEATVSFNATAQGEKGQLILGLLDPSGNNVGFVQFFDGSAYELTSIRIKYGSREITGDGDINTYDHTVRGQEWSKKRNVKVKVKKRVKDKKGKYKTQYVTETRKVTDKFSTFSSFFGKVFVELSNGNLKWGIYKYDSKGRITDRRTYTANKKMDYAFGDVQGVALGFFQYGTAPAVKNMTVWDVRLTKINETTKVTVPKIFKKGGVLIIDAETGSVRYDHDGKSSTASENYLKHLSVLSDFFPLRGGSAVTMSVSPATAAYTTITYRPRYR